MTDREKLIELLGECDRCNAEYCNQCEFGGNIDGCVLRQKEIIADTLLANGVTFATDTNDGSKWISVEDRLPVDEKPVLAYYGFDNKGDGDLGMRFMGTLSYFVFDPHPHWQHAAIRLVVTHWMPLPEPPKAQESD